MLKSKIHRATLTGTELHYEGSIAIDRDLIEAADLLPGEQVHVLNVSNAERLITYVIEAPAGSGTVVLEGPGRPAGSRRRQGGDRGLWRGRRRRSPPAQAEGGPRRRAKPSPSAQAIVPADMAKLGWWLYCYPCRCGSTTAAPTELMTRNVPQHRSPGR